MEITRNPSNSCIRFSREYNASGICFVRACMRVFLYLHTRAFIKTRGARAARESRMQLSLASGRASSNEHFGHGCCHSHVKHNAPDYHYRCVMPPAAPSHRGKRGMTFVVDGRGGRVQKGQEGRREKEHCAFPGAPGALLLVPLPSSATDVIRYHAFVRVRFRVVRDIKLRKGEKERGCKNRRRMICARRLYLCASINADIEFIERKKEQKKSDTYTDTRRIIFKKLKHHTFYEQDIKY